MCWAEKHRIQEPNLMHFHQTFTVHHAQGTGIRKHKKRLCLPEAHGLEHEGQTNKCNPWLKGHNIENTELVHRAGGNCVHLEGVRPERGLEG